MNRHQAVMTLFLILRATQDNEDTLRDARGDLVDNGVDADALLFAINNFRVVLEGERKRLETKDD